MVRPVIFYIIRGYIMKILHVVFSTNRIKYLTKTIESWNNLNYGNHEVTRLLVDDYPMTRNDSIFQLLAKSHNLLLWLNTENLGLSVTWTNFFNWVKGQEFDYILHQEDDVILTQQIHIDTIIDCLESDPSHASVILARQPWYSYESEPKIEKTDVQFKNYWYSSQPKHFSIIFSLYKKSITEYPFKEYWGFNLNEGMIMKFLNKNYKMHSVILKDYNGENIIEHIGEETTGKRVLENEPNYKQFANMDPNSVYSSRTGEFIE
jgi:hypothetical protein